MPFPAECDARGFQRRSTKSAGTARAGGGCGWTCVPWFLVFNCRRMVRMRCTDHMGCSESVPTAPKPASVGNFQRNDLVQHGAMCLLLHLSSPQTSVALALAVIGLCLCLTLRMNQRNFVLVDGKI